MDELIGHGGMASVYAATHRNSKRFAVKVLHPELSAHEDLRVRFTREGYVANRVEHPGAVAVLDDDVTPEGAAFLVMELLDGESVDVIAESHEDKLSVRAVLGIVHPLLDVIAAANSRGIVHRDIKPANLFVTRDGTLKVLDFGIARMRDSQTIQTTHTGHALGTPAFMSPEQALGRVDEIDARTDVWAIGATMFTLLSGALVHEASNAQEQMVFAATKPARSVASLGVEVPAQVRAIIDKALEFRREDRWSDAAAMRDAVAAAYQELFGGDVASAELSSLVAQRKAAVRISGAVSDPLAPTVDALASAPRPEVFQSKPFEATKSVAVVTNETHSGKVASAARFAIGAAVLIVAGVAIGVFVVHAPVQPTPSSATSAAITPSAPASVSTITITPSAEAPTVVATTQASSTPSASASAPKPKPKTNTAPSASASAKTPHDSFDRQ